MSRDCVNCNVPGAARLWTLNFVTSILMGALPGTHHGIVHYDCAVALIELG